MIEKVYPPGSRIFEKKQEAEKKQKGSRKEAEKKQEAEFLKSKKSFMVIALLQQTKRDVLFANKMIKGSFQDDGQEEIKFNISRMNEKNMHTQKKECSTSSHSSDPLRNDSLNV